MRRVSLFELSFLLGLFGGLFGLDAKVMAWPWSNQHEVTITLTPSEIPLGGKATIHVEATDGAVTLSDGGEPVSIACPYDAEVSPKETTVYTAIAQGQGRRWRDRWAAQDTKTLTVTAPLSKWSVSYPASVQKVKAVTADDAIAASVPPAPVVKALEAVLQSQPARGPPAKKMKGLLATPPGKLKAALKAGEPLMTKLRALPQPPANFDGSGGVRDFGMYGNDRYGTCVTAEEAAAKSVISAKTGAPEIRIPDANVISYCRKYGGLNGDYLDVVLDRMTKHGLVDDAGVEHRNDDTFLAVDYTQKLILQLGIFYCGQLKAGIASDQVMAASGSQYGWTLLNARRDKSVDHCVGICGYGSLEFCCQTLGVAVPGNADPKQFCVMMFTWASIGIVSWDSFQNITGELWMRGTDPDRLDADAWDVRYTTAMADITGGNVIPADAVEWTVTYPEQAAVEVMATDAAEAVKKAPYKWEPVVTSSANKLRAIIKVPVEVEVAPASGCPGGNCNAYGGGRRRR